jgi:periplasmic protein TonB
MALASYEHLVLRWQPSQQADRTFAWIASTAIILAVFVGLVLSSLDVPPKTQLDRVLVPERVAKFIRAQEPKPLPPPKPKPKPPEPPKPKIEPKPLETPIPPTEPKQVTLVPERQKPAKPLTEKQLEARERVQTEGLLPHLKELDDLIETADVSAQVKTQIKTSISNNSTDLANNSDAQAFANTATKNSGGINNQQYTTKIGTTQLNEAEVTQTQKTLAKSEKTFEKSAENSKPTSSGSGRSEEEVTLVLDKHKSQLQSLYNRARRTNPALKGTLVLAVTILPNGSVSDIKVISSQLNDPSLVNSIIARIRNFQFGTKNVAPITVNYPIEFLP